MASSSLAVSHPYRQPPSFHVDTSPLPPPRLTGMERRLQDRDAIVLEHVQQRRLARVVEAEEQQLGVLVHESEAGQHIVDCRLCAGVSARLSSRVVVVVHIITSHSPYRDRKEGDMPVDGEEKSGTGRLRTPVDYPHLDCRSVGRRGVLMRGYQGRRSGREFRKPGGSEVARWVSGVGGFGVGRRRRRQVRSRVESPRAQRQQQELKPTKRPDHVSAGVGSPSGA